MIRKTLTALVVAASLTLGGCAGWLEKIQTAVTIGTASVQNPVTEERLNKLESAAIVLFVGLNAWRDLCEQKLINENCVNQIRAAQVYTLQVKPYLAQLRRFVKQNDQVNASVVYNQITEIIAIVRARAAAGGAPIAEPK